MSNTTFPDQAHIDRIREALWAREPFGRAAVMVGAGMSRNARPISVSGGPMPTWTDLVSIIYNQLYREHGTSEDQRRKLTEIEAASRALRLAQEYEVTYSRNELDQLIIETVQDQLYEPGELHELLLKLPWTDVLTTNWDTLLERTCDLVADRRYDAVRTIQEIPRSQKPRIVKLHGSLPTNSPFILTEEDFRTYPQKFAPLVNLAQQVIMESVICLVGFSGDDPNFLHWSGWVRDQFGRHAPRIYLVGWLNLTPAHRKILEARNVTPIDFSLRPGCDWPEEKRHEYALHWFLLSLNSAYKDMNWPRPMSAPVVPKHLTPIFFPVQEYPLAEKHMPSESPDGPAAISELRCQATLWRQNRNHYPGWVVASKLARRMLWANTERWVSQVLTVISEVELQESVEILDELNWRLEICLEPISAEMSAAISKVLSDFQPQLKEASPESRRRWARLTMALVRAARERGENEVFEQRCDALIEYRQLIPGLASQLAYERCLQGLGRLDFKAVEQSLSAWAQESQDPVWSLQRASITAALGRYTESSSLARAALTEIRRRDKGRARIANLSRESCALLFHLAFFFFDELREQSTADDVLPSGLPFGIYDRLDWLAVNKCDVREDIIQITSHLDKESPRQAYQIARLLEITGLPAMGDIRLGNYDRLWARSAECLVSHDPPRAVSIFLLGCSSTIDVSFEQVFSQARIALMSEDFVLELRDACCSAVDFCVEKLAKFQGPGEGIERSHWRGRLELALKLLSRFVLRLDEDYALPVLNLAMQLYRERSVQGEVGVARELSDLFRAIMECLKPQSLRLHALKFAALPLVGLDGFDPFYKDWPEPLLELVERLGEENLPARVKGDRDWSQVVDRLLYAAGLGSLHPRSGAISRLSVLHRWRLLDENETKRFARALWEYRLEDSGFPQDVSVSMIKVNGKSRAEDWRFLELPEVDKGLAEVLFRRKYLSASDQKPPEIGFNALCTLYNISRALDVWPSPLQVNSSESLQVWQQIKVWLKASQPLREFDLAVRVYGRDISVLALRIIREVIIPNLPMPSDDFAREIWSLIEDLSKLKAPVEETLPGILRLDPSRSAEVIAWLRRSAASLDPGPAKAAIAAIEYWVKDGPRQGIEQIPIDLVHEIGLVIATRRPSNLLPACELATWMVETRSPLVDEGFLRLLTVGLRYLLEEARYERIDQKQHEDTCDAEVLRFSCVKMALALNENGFGEISSAIAEWLEQGASDPMARIRNLVSSKNLMSAE